MSPVDSGSTELFINCLCHALAVKSGVRGDDGSSNPGQMFSIWRSDDLDLDVFRQSRFLGKFCVCDKGSDLPLHALEDTRVHGGPTRQDDVGKQVLPDVHISLQYRVECQFMDAALPIQERRARGIHCAQDLRLEERLWTPEPFIGKSDGLAIWEMKSSLGGGRTCCSPDLFLKVEGDVTELLLDTLTDQPLSVGVRERELPFAIMVLSRKLSMSWPARSSWW